MKKEDSLPREVSDDLKNSVGSDRVSSNTPELSLKNRLSDGFRNKQLAIGAKETTKTSYVSPENRIVEEQGMEDELSPRLSKQVSSPKLKPDKQTEEAKENVAATKETDKKDSKVVSLKTNQAILDNPKFKQLLNKEEEWAEEEKRRLEARRKFEEEMMRELAQVDSAEISSYKESQHYSGKKSTLIESAKTFMTKGFEPYITHLTVKRNSRIDLYRTQHHSSETLQKQTSGMVNEIVENKSMSTSRHDPSMHRF